MRPEFRGDSAFAKLLAQTAFGPRNPNSVGHRRCREYLVGQLAPLSDRLTLQEFSHRGYNEEILHLTNIFASFGPETPDRVLLLAHWDTRPRADMEQESSKRDLPILGANDGASGVAVLIELARLFSEQRPAVGVDILLVDGEDYGKSADLDQYSLGARHFVSARAHDYHPRFGILLDMVGDRDIMLPMELHSMRYAPTVVQTVWDTAEQLGLSQFVKIPGSEIFDDHVPLNEGGIPTVNIIDFTYPYWHTLRDTPDKCSPESLDAVGTIVAHVIYSLTPQGSQ